MRAAVVIKLRKESLLIESTTLKVLKPIRDRIKMLCVI